MVMPVIFQSRHTVSQVTTQLLLFQWVLTIDCPAIVSPGAAITDHCPGERCVGVNVPKQSNYELWVPSIDG